MLHAGVQDKEQVIRHRMHKTARAIVPRLSLEHNQEVANRRNSRRRQLGGGEPADELNDTASPHRTQTQKAPTGKDYCRVEQALAGGQAAVGAEASSVHPRHCEQ